MGLHGVANAGISQDVHEGAVAVDLPAFADVDRLLSLHQIREQVHHGDEVSQLLQNDDRPVFAPHQRPLLLWLSDSQQDLIVNHPLLDQLHNAPTAGYLVQLVKHVVDVLLLGVLQFSQDSALVDDDMFVLVVDE